MTTLNKSSSLKSSLQKMEDIKENDSLRRISENREKYDAIVIGGGGIKMFLALGFLDYIESSNPEGSLLKNVKYFAGTSSGAIIAFLLSIGYTPKEIMTYTCSNDVLKLFSDMNLFNLPNEFGLINNKLGIRYLELMALKKLNYVPTFNDIYTKLGNFFMCPAYNLNGSTKDESEVYFSPLTHGDMNACEAIVFSCTVPIVFTKSEYNNNLYIDGGFFDMCPVDKLVQLCGIQDKHILCLRYKNHIENTKINNVFDYAKKVFTSIIKKYVMTFKSDKLDSVQIDTGYDSFIRSDGTSRNLEERNSTGFRAPDPHENQRITETLDFSISVKDRIKLFTNGKQQAEKYYDSKSSFSVIEIKTSDDFSGVSRQDILSGECDNSNVSKIDEDKSHSLVIESCNPVLSFPDILSLVTGMPDTEIKNKINIETEIETQKKEIKNKLD
jgi:NTE family protein